MKPGKLKGCDYMPLLRDYVITSPFGLRKHPITGKESSHLGIDIACRLEKVYSYDDGKVIYLGDMGKTGYGKYAIIQHNPCKTLYAHLDKFLALPGEPVKRKQPIAISGTSGSSTGYHLHFEIIVNGKRVDPQMFSQIKEVKIKSNDKEYAGLYYYNDNKTYIEVRSFNEDLGNEVLYGEDGTLVKINPKSKEDLIKVKEFIEQMLQNQL